MPLGTPCLLAHHAYWHIMPIGTSCLLAHHAYWHIMPIGTSCLLAHHIVDGRVGCRLGRREVEDDVEAEGRIRAGVEIVISTRGCAGRELGIATQEPLFVGDGHHRRRRGAVLMKEGEMATAPHRRVARGSARRRRS